MSPLHGAVGLPAKGNAMGLLLDQLLAYLMNLAAGLRTDAIGDARARRIQQQLANDTARVRAIQDLRSLTDHLRLAGIRVAQALDTLDLTKRERPLFLLLTDETFQDDVAHWLTAFDGREKAEQQEKILRRMGAVLQAEPGHVEQLRQRYFDLVERTVFADPVLAHWRLQLGISTVLERMDELHGELLRGRREGREMGEAMIAQLAAHGQHLQQMSRQLRDLDHKIFERFTEEQRRAALDRFRTLALDSCDIVDLANLPEQDRHVAARQLELRRLYVPLRVSVEFAGDGPIGEEQLHEIEARRDALRARQAPPEDKHERVPAGHRLAEARRLVVLGDPGSGKTTLLRWIATAYLLRLKNDPAWREIPDVDTLPEADWLPILIRCRDQDPESFAGGLDALLERTFRATELGPEESAALQPVLREKLARGEAMLLVDGLDEITQPAARMRFCQQIERLQAAYPEAPMVVTSRIVGYRELGYRLGRTGGLERGFEHVTVAEFSRADKDDFARRWCRLTEVPERVAAAEKELVRDVHSSDRIERLTANPMLLTTMALVKRKIGRLPQRRAELYYEAVQVRKSVV